MNAIDVEELKRSLPLPWLLHRIGFGDFARNSCRSPFRADKKPSWGIFQRDGKWFFKDQGTGDSGDEITLLARWKGLDEKRDFPQLLKLYADLAGVHLNGEAPKAPTPTPNREATKPFDWLPCVTAIGPDEIQKLAQWRGYSREFCDWLRTENLIGFHEGNWALPVHGGAGAVVATHYRVDRGTDAKPDWFYYPKGIGVRPLIFGDTKRAANGFVFESPWDAFAVMDRLGWHKPKSIPDTAIIITRGAGNAKLIARLFAPKTTVYAFKQNDETKNGKNAADEWLADVCAHAGSKVVHVFTPAEFKDVNDWTKAGATKEEIETAIRKAKLADVPESASEGTPQSVEIETQIPDAADIRGQIVAILTDSNLTSREQRKAIGGAVVESLAKRGQLYFHAELRDFRNALFFDRARARLERIQSDSFLAWLAEWTGINRADTLFNAVAAEVETAALSEIHAKSILPETFWTRREDRIYVSNGDATLCRISSRKVEMLPNGADGVLFSAGRTLHPWRLTEPRDFFETCRLFADIQGAAPNAREIVRLWTISLPTNPRGKPPLVAYGDIGSGKTTLMRGVCEIYGLPPNVAKVEEKLEADFWPTVDAGGLLILDNADSRTKWLADAVAAAATGGCVSRRRLYTDADIVPLRARAWLAITTSNPTFANDSGLADRLLVVRLKRREGTTSDAALSDEIAANRDTALSFVAHTLAAALADTAPTPDSLNSRHPDFAGFAVRIGRVLGCESQAVGALQTAEADKSLFCLQNDTLGAALLAHVTEETTLEGDAGELRTALAANDTAIAEWSNKSFGRRLSALWPHVSATFDAKRTECRCGWKFRIAKRSNAGLRV